jgi:hypothetical protein
VRRAERPEQREDEEEDVGRFGPPPEPKHEGKETERRDNDVAELRQDGLDEEPALVLRPELGLGTELDLAEAAARVGVGPQPDVQRVPAGDELGGGDGVELGAVPVARDRLLEPSAVAEIAPFR